MALAFEQQKKESDKAFAAFAIYLSLGPERSTAAVATKLAKSEQLVRRWSARWHWTERVAAHAAHMALVEREATEVLARGKAAEWAKRQQEVREREWEMHERCIEAAKRALKSFMEREKVYANLADISRILEVASKLGRLASGMATDRTEVGGEVRVGLSAEFKAMLAKVYSEHPEAGPVVEAEIVDRPALPDAGGKV